MLILFVLAIQHETSVTPIKKFEVIDHFETVNYRVPIASHRDVMRLTTKEKVMIIQRIYA